MAHTGSTGINFTNSLDRILAPLTYVGSALSSAASALGARIGRINFAMLLPVAQVALLIVSFITLLGGLFTFLGLPLMGAAGIVAFTNPMFALPPAGFAVLILSFVLIFKLLP